ncbi:Replication protein A 70 kDa DNA-binding subunit C [Linum perenne]
MAPSQYKPLCNEFVIQFTSNTTVEEVDDVPCIPRFNFTFIEETGMEAKLNKRVDLTDVIGHLVEHTKISIFKCGFRTSLKKDLHLKLSGGCSVRVTLWERAASQMEDILKSVGEEGIILIVSSTYLCGKSVEDMYFSSSSATKLYANLDIPEVSNFTIRNYPIDSSNAITPSILVEIINIIRSPSITIQQMNDLQLDDNNKDKYYTIQCKVRDIREGWCYVGCINCPRKVKEGQDEYYCWSCEKTFTKTCLRFRVRLQVEDNTADSELIIFDYEGQRFFKTDADNLYATSGETRQTPPNFVMQLIGQEMKFQIKFPSYLTIPLTEYPVYRILGVMEAVPPTADAGKEEKYISGSSSSQSPTSSLTVTETPVGVPAGNLNLADTINLGGEDSPIHQAVNVITDDMPPTNAKEATRKRRKIIIQTSDSEKE